VFNVPGRFQGWTGGASELPGNRPLMAIAGLG
jgi:hypothetical protein